MFRIEEVIKDYASIFNKDVATSQQHVRSYLCIMQDVFVAFEVAVAFFSDTLGLRLTYMMWNIATESMRRIDYKIDIEALDFILHRLQTGDMRSALLQDLLEAGSITTRELRVLPDYFQYDNLSDNYLGSDKITVCDTDTALLVIARELRSSRNLDDIATMLEFLLTGDYITSPSKYDSLIALANSQGFCVEWCTHYMELSKRLITKTFEEIIVFLKELIITDYLSRGIIIEVALRIG